MKRLLFSVGKVSPGVDISINKKYISASDAHN